MMMQTYLRRGQRSLERAALDPRVRTAAAITAWTGSGFLLSGISLGNAPQPVAMGLICSAAGWKALLIALGAVLGYPSFWGAAGNPGIVWAAAGCLLALMVNRHPESREQPLMLPVICAGMTLVTDLGFRLILHIRTPLVWIPVQMAAALFSGILFTQAARCRDPVTQWLVWGVGVLALSRISLGPYPVPGYGAAALLAVGGAFPAAALGGLALDLARIGEVPMTAVMCLAYFLRMLPYDRKWQPLLAPALAYGILAAVWGVTDLQPLPGLLLGGGLGFFLPPRPQIAHRRGDTGAAQVRLELGAQMLASAQDRILELTPPPIDREALLEKAKQRACGGCAFRRKCAQKGQFSLNLLENPLEADCQNQDLLIPELRRAREQLRQLRADRKRQREYRLALAQQYRFLSGYLRDLADRLPRKPEQPLAVFRLELSVRSREKEAVNGDRCFAFPGMECQYYVLLCDGMGTGTGAAREARDAGKLLRQLLCAGFPAEHALQTLNSLLALGGKAGAVTLDLAQIALDTGLVHIYKWGAAPSWVLSRTGAKKIGTAAPPPGISLEGGPISAMKLSLRRGEALILLSDGVEPEEVRGLRSCADAPPGTLAAKILEAGIANTEDDATAVVLRLRPSGLPSA